MALTYRGIPYQNETVNIPIDKKELTYRGISYQNQSEEDNKSSSQNNNVDRNNIAKLDSVQDLDNIVNWDHVYSSLSEVSPYISPKSPVQLYQQRWAAIKAGKIYTQLKPDSFESYWINNNKNITYQDWLKLLKYEANAVVSKQNFNSLNILLGDDITLWFPLEMLPSDKLWLNQSITQDTTKNILNRISNFNKTNPNTIYLMTGINDIFTKQNDSQISDNVAQILKKLRYIYSQTEIILISILPTNNIDINYKIQQVNQSFKEISLQEEAKYKDIYDIFTDSNGKIRQGLTIDGIKLSYKGYALLEKALFMS